MIFTIAALQRHHQIGNGRVGKGQLHVSRAICSKQGINALAQRWNKPMGHNKFQILFLQHFRGGKINQNCRMENLHRLRPFKNFLFPADFPLLGRA